MTREFDTVVIGGGIMGLALARTLRQREPHSKILVLEKESHVAEHASGRNSGVLHAGFYYTSDTLKARFCVQGNRAMREFCTSRRLPLKETGKLVVATTEAEVKQLHELERRGKLNGSGVSLITAEEARKIEPNAFTVDQALWSPLTAAADPLVVCQTLQRELQSDGVHFEFRSPFLYRDSGGRIVTPQGAFAAKRIVNCAGLYADRIAQQFGFGKRYTIIPFKGLYLKYGTNTTDLRTNIYPVPNLKHTFLGVHFTKTVHDQIKIGPTAIPSFWREHYDWRHNFKFDEFCEILFYEAKLFLTNAFGFRSLAFEEMRKYSRTHLVNLAMSLARNLDRKGFREFARPGIRAQLIDTSTLQLVMDFIVEGDRESIHVLNAISPGFTCSLSFAEYVYNNYIAERAETTANAAVHGAMHVASVH